jgi:glutamate--cysteine ligase
MGAIGDEVLWCASMPCNLPADDAIPIGRYGSSNVGRAKSIYRMGHSHRYGRRMQTISGIHYNFSLPGDMSNEAYFALIRNFRRYSWLLLYLFGASPAVCASFVAGRPHELERLSEDTFYLPHATSLRMGRLGYQSDAQSSLAVSYNNLESYAASLQEALTKPYPAYEAVGIRDGNDYRQLATSLLQIENEFYGTIRPKRVIRPGERALHALRDRGVEYVEVRLMDLDPFHAVGITAGTMRFLDIFLLHCLLRESPPDTPQEIAAIVRNQQRVAARGREPGLRLSREPDEVTLANGSSEI